MKETNETTAYRILPELDTEATGDADGLVTQLTAADDDLGLTVRIIPERNGHMERQKVSVSG